jgi:hypothetical protein
MKETDWAAKAIKGLAVHKPSKGFDARILAAMRAPKTSPALRWASGLAVTWACAGAALMALLPSRVKVLVPNVVDLKLAFARGTVDAVRLLSDAAQNAAGLPVGRLAVQLCAATLVAAAVLAVLAPRPVFAKGGVR